MGANIQELFDQSTHVDTFSRVAEHPLNLYLGEDFSGRKTLFLLSEVQPAKITSSELIDITIGERKDKKWGLSFSLINEEFESLFFSFCQDIIDRSRVITDTALGTSFICDRYLKWQKLLKKKQADGLGFESIMGLVGEMLFLKNTLIPLYGVEIAIKSWIGPEYADQDFVCPDKWFEVKSTSTGASSVKISSVEQLDVDTLGELVIVYLDKTSETNPKRVTLNQLYQEILTSVNDITLQNIFNNTLLGLGYYPKPEYNRYSFYHSSTCCYLVSAEFPCLRQNRIPAAVSHVHYELSIGSINSFLKKE